jgi:hypothetical protein
MWNIPKCGLQKKMISTFQSSEMGEMRISRVKHNKGSVEKWIIGLVTVGNSERFIGKISPHEITNC